MRTKKFSAIALVALAAGLSLTACNGDDTAGSSPSESSATAGSQSGGAGAGDGAGDAPNGGGNESSGDPSSGSDEKSGEGSDSPNKPAANTCRTANLSFRTAHGMGEGQLVIHMKNIGTNSCSMQGFPGVDLKGKDGTISAGRSDRSTPRVTLAPGEDTNFTLDYPPNTSGGSGTTFTTLVITPPAETHSRTVTGQNINVAAQEGDGAGITVNPVGTHK